MQHRVRFIMQLTLTASKLHGVNVTIIIITLVVFYHMADKLMLEVLKDAAVVGWLFKWSDGC